MRDDYQERPTAPAWLRVLATLLTLAPSWAAHRLRRGHERPREPQPPVS